jgi:uncharacterized protein YcaQ
VRSADFARESPGGGWWGWKPEKRWLEAAFAQGDLMVARRDKFHRVYDVPQRVLASRPDLLQAPQPDPQRLRRQLITESLIALGIAPARWLADYFRLNGRVGDSEMQAWVECGEVVPVAVAGHSAPWYVHRQHRELLEQVRSGDVRAQRTVLLSPFDPLVWDRQRALELFDFDYRLECYTPAPKRQFGYFVLPILDRDRLIGRLDAKAHRSAGVFEIKALYLQPGVRPSAALARRLIHAIKACAHWHDTPQIRVSQVAPADFAAVLREQLAGERAP